MIRAALATGNRHKLEELGAALPGWELELLERDDIPEETGSTYEENARIKATHGVRFAGDGIWVIGEDSGIELAALGGAPGVRSSRWADDGVARALAELAGVEERQARYVCVMVARDAAGREFVSHGALEGAIALEPRGHGGFGYDPIFIPSGQTSTVAELGDDWKQRNSHRARAAQALQKAFDAEG
ncbi:MAG: non-canonical purine NTP pyrophosphatase [Gaiella sp.]